MKSVLAVLVLAAGCAGSPAATGSSGTSDGGAADAAPPDTGPVFSGATPFKTGNNTRCLPLPLGTGCHVLLTGVPMGCSGAGLSPASQADIEAITTVSLKSLNPMPPPLEICQLAELPPNCTAASELGWCYIRGSCWVDAGTMCDYSICESSGFHEGEGYSASWLVCP